MQANWRPIQLLPYKIQKRENFVVRSHPDYHPVTDEYSKYWKGQLNRCLKGYWALDKDKSIIEPDSPGGYRWMPGPLYFYINCTKISFEAGQAPKQPNLRDIEWFLGYGFITAEGFSGFKKDKEYTCCRIADKLKRQEFLTPGEEYLYSLPEVKKSITKRDGTLKKYVEAREYLYKCFDKPMGEPMFHNEALNFIMLTSRGVGKSYCLNGMKISYKFTFNGAKDLKSYLSEDTKSTQIVASGDEEKLNELLDKFIMVEDNLYKNVGSYKDEVTSEPGILWRPTAGSLNINTKSPKTKRLKVKGSQNIYTGSDAKIVPVSLARDYTKVVSYRAEEISIDEIGLTDNLLKILSLGEPSLASDYKWGKFTLAGTGGDFKKVKEAQEVFENPESYLMVSYEYDLSTGSNKKLGCFIPGYYRYGVYRDANGNTDYQRAFDAEARLLDKKKRENVKQYFEHLVSWPVIPSHMFMSNSGSLFDMDRVERRLTYLNQGAWRTQCHVGKTYYGDNGTPKFMPDTSGNLTPFVERGQEKKQDDWRGAVVIYEYPEQDRPKVDSQTPLYMTFYDQVLNDKTSEDSGTSLCAAIVFKKDSGNPNKIKYNVVAEWYGRHSRRSDNHEEVFRLAGLYDSRIFPESNIRDFESYALTTNRLHLLEEVPHEAIGKINASQKANYGFGFKVTPNTIPDLETNFSELSQLIIEEYSEVYDETYGDFIRNYETFVDQCWSRRLLSEMKYYNRNDNFDAVSAMFLCSLWFKQQSLQPIKAFDKKEEESTMERLVKEKEKYQKLAKESPAFNW